MEPGVLTPGGLEMNCAVRRGADLPRQIPTLSFSLNPAPSTLNPPVVTVRHNGLHIFTCRNMVATFIFRAVAQFALPAGRITLPIRRA
jgi:hypothetical protein